MPTTKPTNELPALLSEAELAEHLGLCARTVARLRERRRGPAHIRLGRRVAYRASDVAAWLDAQRIGGEG